MALTPGTRLGHYEIAEQIGAGGMGEVYRAIDTNLKRAVAIKVLPDALAADVERLARLRREAEVLASLNHPHIAQIYGLEKSEGSTALVLELVDGPTLADRIVVGPLPLEEALPIARQIAEALEAAHEQGIVHRDLKPANIKLRPDGQVKVLDFGLAKLATGELAPSGAAALTASPTLTVHATMLGVILGTAAYMSPEQAKGKTVDRRSDIWAFGVVLCEMLTGRRMYDAETAAETLARIIEREPDLSALPSTTPPSVRTVLERCLTKDPRARLQAIGEARILLDRAITHPQSAPVADGSVQRRSRVGLPWTVAGVLASALIAMLGAWAPWRVPPASSSTKVYGQIGADVSLMTDIGTAAVLSPDGELLVFAAQTDVGQPSRLYVRRLTQLQATPLSGTDDARSPFFSPDGKWIAFFAGGKLKKVAVTGGPVSTLTDAPAGRGGSWAEDNTITFQPEISAATSSLARVSSEGGKADLFSTETRGRARFPQVLAGGAGVLYTRSAGNGSADVVIERSGGERKVVLQGAYGRYLPSGHLVYLQESTLFAVAFDIEQLEVIGRPVPVIEGVMAAPRGTSGAQFAMSETGTLVYVPEPTTANDQPIMWMDSSGTLTPLLAKPTNWSNPRFSPDGRKLAFEIIDASAKISIYDVVRGTLDPLTFERDTRDTGPAWTPDGQRVTFLSNRDNATVRNLYWKRADNTGSVQRLTVSNFEQFSGSWHLSGKVLAFGQQSRDTNPDIWILPMEGDEKSGWKPGTPKVFVNTIANEGYPMFSPDGRWLAYTSNETRTTEVYVRAYPGPGGPWQVSSGGGRSPAWSRTKPELFFTTGDGQIMVASYRAEGDAFQRDQPRLWSEKRFLQRPGSDDRTLDLHPDGTRFAVAADTESQVAAKQDKIVFVFNFFDELRRRVPVSKK
jgi:serine/threonine-protein kinase